MNNEKSILYHKVRWFLTNGDTDFLSESWEKSIKKFICAGYREGEFAVEYNLQEDSLHWLILFDKNEAS
jgi:hypothetical protein